MNESQISLHDWHRIFAGGAPGWFYIELVIRAGFTYILILFSMRLMGKRMSAQLSRLDLAALVAMSSAIGVPMLTADRGMLPALLISLIVVGLVRAVSAMSVYSVRVERMLQGEPDLLVKDGVLFPAGLRTGGISRERIFAQLRSKKLVHTGQVKRLYLESSGLFTLMKEKEPSPGLLVLPEWDESFIAAQASNSEKIICHFCGSAEYNAPIPEARCCNCGHDEWTIAVNAIGT